MHNQILKQAMDAEEANTEKISIDPGFKPPRRRTRLLLAITVAVFGVVVYLIYLMAQGPDAVKMSRDLVDEIIASLPEAPLTATDLRTGVEGLEQALNMYPDSEYAMEAVSLLQTRVATQIEYDILQDNLDQAHEILAEASSVWPDESQFMDEGPLQQALAKAKAAQELREEVAELLDTAEQRLLLDSENSDAIREALAQLKRALDLDPDNSRAQTIQNDIRQNVKNATRKALSTGKPEEAKVLMDAVQDVWQEDSELAGLRKEVLQELDDLEHAVELQRLLDRADQQLAADKLSQPNNDNALNTYHQVISMEPENERAKSGIKKVEDRYETLIRQAISRESITKAKELLTSLESSFPDNAMIASFQSEIETIETVPESKPQAEPAISEPVQKPSIAPTDDEGRLWFDIKDSCDENNIRRYINQYPAGRYIEDAWRRITTCLEAR